MFAAAMARSAHPQRGAAAAAVLAVAVLAAGCGGQRQDAGEPSGQFKVNVTRATFPAQQAIGRHATLRIDVRNDDHRQLPYVAVTVETHPKGATGAAAAAPVAFGTRSADTRLADDVRPVWIVDRGPKGGDNAHTNTWALGSMYAGETTSFVWHVLPVAAGSYRLTWSVSPGLNGKARAARGGRSRGSFDVTISNKPVPATVDDNGNVVRGARAAKGSVGN